MIPAKKKKQNLSGLKNEEAHHPWIKKKYRRIGDIFARRLVNTSITPNQITAIGGVILCFSAYFFFRADYLSLIIAGILLQLGYLFDFIDGSLARMKKITSDYGEWLDLLSGTYGWVLVYLGATWGVYNQTHEPYIILFGLLAAIGTLLKNLTQNSFLNTFKFTSEFGKENYKKFGSIMFLRPTGPFVYTVFTLAAFLNKMYWVLIFLGVYTPVYTIMQNVLFTLKARKELLQKAK